MNFAFRPGRIFNGDVGPRDRRDNRVPLSFCHPVRRVTRAVLKAFEVTDDRYRRRRRQLLDAFVLACRYSFVYLPPRHYRRLLLPSCNFSFAVSSTTLRSHSVGPRSGGIRHVTAIRQTGPVAAMTSRQHQQQTDEDWRAFDIICSSQVKTERENGDRNQNRWTTVITESRPFLFFILNIISRS